MFKIGDRVKRIHYNNGSPEQEKYTFFLGEIGIVTAINEKEKWADVRKSNGYINHANDFGNLELVLGEWDE